MVADMETECYPCIPMHSASNQKRMNHSTITMIKTEPLSEDVNVVVDDQENSNDLKSAGSSSLSHSLSRQQNLQKQAANTRKRSVQNQNQQLQQTQQNTTTTTTAPSRVQQHTIRLSRVSLDFFFSFQDVFTLKYFGYYLQSISKWSFSIQKVNLVVQGNFL